MAEQAKVRCGDCRYFVRDGRCSYFDSEASRAPGQPFGHAPFWVWSDCYSDREQVRSNAESACPTFEDRAAAKSASPAPRPLTDADVGFPECP